MLRGAGIESIAALDSADAIAELLPRFLNDVKSRRASLPTHDAVKSASRLGRTESLAQRLHSVSH